MNLSCTHWNLGQCVLASMTCQPRASRPKATCLGVLWVTAIIACLDADAFAVGPQHQHFGGGSLRATPSGGGASITQWRGERLERKTPKTSGGVPCMNARNSSMQLRAEGDTNGESGGPILLAERSVNRVTLIGRVGLDPEVRHLPSGDRMATFSLATSEQWRDKASGQVRSRTEWHRVVVFDKGLVDLVEAFVHKGRRLYVDGSLQTRRWVASDGQERYTTEVLLSKYKGELVLLESPEDKHGGASTSRITGSADISTNGTMSRLAGASQTLRSTGLPSGAFGSQIQPGGGGARSAIGAHKGTTTASRPNAPWH